MARPPRRRPNSRPPTRGSNRPEAVVARPSRTDDTEPLTALAARLCAEFFGTFVLVLAGCGSAILAATAQHGRIEVGIGYLGVALAFGLAVLVMAITVGGISGGHFNPAVTLGLACAGRAPWRLVIPYVVTQLVGATAAAALLFGIASGRPGFDATRTGFASNGYGDRSPTGFTLGSVVLSELVLTAVFVAVIIAATSTKASKTLAPIAIGLTLTLIHLISIPVDNTSVNPARSLSVAFFAGPAALGQVWVFLLVPLVGGTLAGLGFRALTGLGVGVGLGGEGSGDS